MPRVGGPRRSWLDIVARDMGKTGYAFGAAVFPALYVGANHRRERIYFVADSHGQSAAPVLRPPGRSDGFDFWHGFWEDRVWVKTRKARDAGVSPRRALWLMGFPDPWLFCGQQAMRSFRNRRRSS